MDASAWIDLLLKRAPELRKAGILALSAEGYSAELAPAPPETPPPPKGGGLPAEPDYLGRPLEDPASYPDGRVPGFVIKPLTEE